MPKSVRLQQYTLTLKLDPKAIEAAQKAANTTGSSNSSSSNTTTIEDSRGRRLARRLAMATTDPDTGITAIGLGPEDTAEQQQRDPRALLQDDGGGGDDPYASWPSVASESFTVADPRPPTVELKVCTIRLTPRAQGWQGSQAVVQVQGYPATASAELPQCSCPVPAYCDRNGMTPRFSNHARLCCEELGSAEDGFPMLIGPSCSPT